MTHRAARPSTSTIPLPLLVTDLELFLLLEPSGDAKVLVLRTGRWRQWKFLLKRILAPPPTRVKEEPPSPMCVRAASPL